MKRLITWSTRKGKLLIILVFVVLTVACAGCVTFLAAYPHLAGEWASSLVIPSPPQAQLVAEKVFADGVYNNRLQVYVVPNNLQNTRKWFNDYFPMSPIDNVLNDDDINYNSLWIDPSKRSEYNVLLITGYLTIPNAIHTYDMVPSCFDISLYKSVDAITNPDFKTYFSNIQISAKDGSTIALIGTCWPNW